MPKPSSEEHSPLSECFIQSYDSGDQDYPIVAVKMDPREPGYTIPDVLALCTDTRYAAHKFTGVTPITDDRRVFWIYRILPGPWVPFSDNDAKLGRVQSRRRSVVNTGQLSSQTLTTKTTYDGIQTGDVVIYEIERVNSSGTGADGADTNPAFPVFFEDDYADARGPVQIMSQLVAATGAEVGTLVVVANAIYARTITNDGTSPYTTAPTVTIADSGGGTGSGATAISEINAAGDVIGLFITNPGSGYTTPLVSFSGGGGAGAAATVTTTPSLAIETQYQPFAENRYLLEKSVQTWAVPGVDVLGSEIDADTGIVVNTATREVAAGTRAGIDVPASTNVSLWTVAANTVGTVASATGLRVGMDVTVSGDARTSPTVNGTHRITAISGTLIALDFAVTSLAGAGSYGAMVLSAPVYREVQKKSAATSVQISSQVDISSLTNAGKVFYTTMEYPWPQRLTNIDFVKDYTISGSVPTGTWPIPTTLTYRDGYTFGGNIAIRMKAYSGKSSAKITRSYSVTAPAQVTPDKIVLATGEIIIEGGSRENGIAISVQDAGTGSVASSSYGVAFSVATVPHCLNNGIAISSSGTGSATAVLHMDSSSPAALSPTVNYDWTADWDAKPGRLGLYEATKVELIQPTF